MAVRKMLLDYHAPPWQWDYMYPEDMYGHYFPEDFFALVQIDTLIWKREQEKQENKNNERTHYW